VAGAELPMHQRRRALDDALAQGPRVPALQVELLADREVVVEVLFELGHEAFV
jgi:hypothetical protein